MTHTPSQSRVEGSRCNHAAPLHVHLRRAVLSDDLEGQCKSLPRFRELHDLVQLPAFGEDRAPFSCLLRSLLGPLGSPLHASWSAPSSFPGASSRSGGACAASFPGRRRRGPPFQLLSLALQLGDLVFQSLAGWPGSRGLPCGPSPGASPLRRHRAPSVFSARVRRSEMGFLMCCVKKTRELLRDSTTAIRFSRRVSCRESSRLRRTARIRASTSAKLNGFVM